VYVCICNNVTERDIHSAVRAGARTFACLERDLGVSTCCGQCRCFADDILREALDTTRVAPSLAGPLLPLAT
jgi:bacterioferritin-associated ferredoxin